MTSNPSAVLRTRHRKLSLIAIAVLAAGAVLWTIGNARADTLFVLAVAPSFFLLWRFHHADKYKTESVSLLAWTFVLGGIGALVAAFVEPSPPSNAGVAVTFLYFIFGVALIEELAKFLAVRILPYRSAQFDEAMDGVIFGITAALGFATVENVFYVFHFGGAVALFRAFVSVPGHAFYGAVMGYYLGEAKVKKRPQLALWGLALAIVIHATFDTLTQFSGTLGLIVLPLFVWFVYFAVVKKEIAKAQSESLYATPAASTSGTVRTS